MKTIHSMMTTGLLCAAEGLRSAYIYERNGHIWVNIKCLPEWIKFWRETYESVVPAYHMNKEHWNSVILDGKVPDKEVKRMIAESYDIVAGK